MRPRGIFRIIQVTAWASWTLGINGYFTKFSADLFSKILTILILWSCHPVSCCLGACQITSSLKVAKHWNYTVFLVFPLSCETCKPTLHLFGSHFCNLFFFSHYRSFWYVRFRENARRNRPSNKLFARPGLYDSSNVFWFHFITHNLF